MNRTNDRRSGEDTLDTALDALARGNRAPFDALDSDTRSTFGLLAGWAALGGLDSFATPAPHPRVTAPAERTPAPMDASLLPSPFIVPAHSQPRSYRGMRLAWSAIAWVLIAALIGGAAYGALPYARDHMPLGLPLGMFQDGTATPEFVPESFGAVNYAGDAGRSWVLGDQFPTTGEATVNGSLDESQLIGSPLIVGDSIFYSSSRTDGSWMFTRYDLAKREVVWEVSGQIFGALASDGQRVFGFLLRGSGDAIRPVPIAISVETGEVAWTGPALVQGSDSTAAGPVILNDTVYFTDALGNTLALAAVDAAVRWQYPERFLPGVTYSDFDDAPALMPAADMVVTDDGTFVELPSKTVVKLDSTTGEELDSFNVIDQYGGDIEHVELQAAGDRLVVRAMRSLKSVPGSDGRTPYQPTTILVFDTASMNLVVESGLPEVLGNVVVTTQEIYVAGRIDLAGTVQIFRIDLDDGEPDEMPLDISGPPTWGPDWTAMSMTGDVLMILIGSHQVVLFDTASGEVIVDTSDLPDAMYQPLQLWNGTPITVTMEGDLVQFGPAAATPTP
jgi:outer membrane protein assembly factor BamB